MEPLSPGSAAKDIRRLSALASARGDRAEAVRMLEFGCAETVRRIGPLHSCHADLLTRLAAAYAAIGRHHEAIASQLQALEILAALDGIAHPHYLRSLADLALLQQRAGEFEAAEGSYRQACALQHRLPERRMETAESYSRLAWLLFAQGRSDAGCWAAAGEAEACRDRAIRMLLGGGPERVQQTALADIQAGYQLWLAIALDERWAGPTANTVAFDLVQRRKLLRLHCSLSLRLQAGAIPADMGVKARWTALRRQLTEAMLKLGKGSAAQLRRINDQRMALDELERRLVEAAADAPDAVPGCSRPECLAAALPTDTCLVELVRFRPHRLPQSPRELPTPEAPSRYVALVLRGGKPEPSLHDLGPADAIDRLVHRHRSRLAGCVPGDARGLVDDAEPEPEQSPGEHLRNLLIDPLRQAWGNCRRLVFAMDGELALLPMDTLPDDSANRYLADRYVVSYLNVGREWLTRPGGTATRPVVVAAPRFRTRWSPFRALGWLRRRDESAQRRPAGDFRPLPGSRMEGKRVAEQLQALLWLGWRASKPAVLGLRSPRILHIASHGYFRRPAQSAGGPGQWLPPPDTPMLRAGLALAGANAGNGTGLLSAEEMATMDLHGTEMVVLSACDSGIGEATAGEGVTGLRRALALAGARSLVVSLWKVDDLAAALLMERFYRHLVVHRLSRGDALAQAKAELRRMTVGELRSSGIGLDAREFVGWRDHQRPFEQPFHWGAFVLSGCPDPLPTSP